MARVDGPGFSVEFPMFQVMKDRRDDYANGEYIVQRREGEVVTRVIAYWERGAIVGNPVAERGYLARAERYLRSPLVLRRTFDSPVAQGLTARGFDVSFDDATALLTLIQCGRRSITLVFLSSFTGAEELHLRMVRSFRCTPDPALEVDPG